jgi:hypothetical protein
MNAMIKKPEGEKAVKCPVFNPFLSASSVNFRGCLIQDNQPQMNADERR